jgi:hypothetical protein
VFYILETETNAKFDNQDDAKAYFRRLKDDEDHAHVYPPRRDPKDGLYVVKLWKSETVMETTAATSKVAIGG